MGLFHVKFFGIVLSLTWKFFWSQNCNIFFEVWGLKTSFGQFVSQRAHQAITPEAWLKFPQKRPETIKSQKMDWLWGLGPKNYFWTILAQKTYWAISAKSYFQFSQTGPQFVQNHIQQLNSIKSPSLKKYLDLGVWNLKTSFGKKTLGKILAPIFRNKASFYQESYTESNNIMS